MDSMKFLTDVNTLHLNCKNLISSKKQMSKKFVVSSRSYKKDLAKYKCNLSKYVENPSQDQKKELLKIRERSEFNNAMVNYAMCTLVDKNRTANACRDTILNENNQQLNQDNN